MAARLLLFAFLCLPLVSATVGCGDGSRLATVTGTVTLNGAPLENAQVLFRPEQGRPSLGTTDSLGKYEIYYTMDRPGALVGSHTVSISTAIDQEDETLAPERVPSRYNAESELVRDIEPGNNVFDFELDG